MIIHVTLLQYRLKTFTYAVPDHLQHQVVLGCLIQVPLKYTFVPALVVAIDQNQKNYPFKIKPIAQLYPFPKDSEFALLLKKIAHLYQIDSLVLLARIENFLNQKEEDDIDRIIQNSRVINHTTLTLEQQQVLCEIQPYIQEKKHQTFVLHGVTGSGKTEIYKKLIETTIAKQESVIFMLPEVSLALRFEKLFQVVFPNMVFGFHSATTVACKKTLWQKLLNNQSVIIVGVHLPVLLPIANLGLIIVDEEHDAGYQEKKHPKLHSRDMAILKAYLAKIPIVLGSATPSVQTLYNVETKGWKLLTMYQRYAGKFPQVSFVNLSEQKKRKHFWFAQTLLNSIADRLEKKEQTIIFLNRRGFSFFVQCPCSFIFVCHQCSVSLTLHAGNQLICHYCAHKETMADRCPSCSGSHHDFLKKGIGTQQVVALLSKIFPQARIERADLDSTSKKRSWAQTVEQMYDGQIDILVGTQSITKGYHFPRVTLVGVLWADLNLHFPMYNASEVCLQQLIQVAGRAGRQSDESQVIIQSFSHHPIFDFLNEQNYSKFYDFEIEKRKLVGYPPYKHLAEIEIKMSDAVAARKQANEIANGFKAEIVKRGFDMQVLGPVESMVYKIKAVFSEKLYLKAHSRTEMIKVFEHMKASIDQGVSVFFVIDPV